MSNKKIFRAELLDPRTVAGTIWVKVSNCPPYRFCQSKITSTMIESNCFSSPSSIEQESKLFSDNLNYEMLLRLGFKILF